MDQKTCKTKVISDLLFEIRKFNEKHAKVPSEEDQWFYGIRAKK